jgi:hypothetical protein
MGDFKSATGTSGAIHELIPPIPKRPRNGQRSELPESTWKE